VGLVGTEKTNIITGLSFTGVCDTNWEEEDDAKLQHYVQFPLRNMMLPHKITTGSPGREWHDNVFNSFHVAQKV
jgi:hypothetical protein